MRIAVLAATLVLLALPVSTSAARARCSTSPTTAARFIVPPPPFVGRVVAVARRPMPPFEPKGRGPAFKRLYLVTFLAVKGNAVLPTGHRYSQFAYVSRPNIKARWCFLKGGSGP
ncbi:MAG TPA: hypothetical protein VKC62_12990 [Gaiellaceae bacterium]|nr:hypothetical protein [Gaiellaceae bacterium]